jgi:predicted dienelactone hydrolase
MNSMRKELAVLLVIGLSIAGSAAGREAPSVPRVDAPELAKLGNSAVGVTTLELVDAARADRRVMIDLWYPAVTAVGSTPVTYEGSLTAEPPAAPTRFTRPGIAVRDAERAPGPFPFVLVSHGYDNQSVLFSWLTENLASKGYVVAAIRHADPPITDRARFPEAVLNRPLDVTFVARALQRSLAEEKLVDPARTAFIGYSMGGYGVLSVAGAARNDALRVPGLRAVVTLAPAGAGFAGWGDDGLAALTVPMLFIAGDRDHTVDYPSGARTFFDRAVNSNRYLLTYRGGGHRIGLGPAPEEMRSRLWDLDWFEDTLWSAERIVGINLHFITAFLDRYVKDDASRAAYLDGLVPESSKGEWPAEAAGGYGAYSPGTDGITVWKGFQRQHAEGLELLHAAPR